MKTRLTKLTALLAALALCAGLAVPAFASKPQLDEETKRAHYEEMVNIAAEISEETGENISLAPFEEFEDEYWTFWNTPEHFRDAVMEILKQHPEYTEIELPESRVVHRLSKAIRYTYDNKMYPLVVTMNYETDYNPSIQGQAFISFNVLNSSIADSSGNLKWDHATASVTFSNNNQTAEITLIGYVTYYGVQMNPETAHFNVTFDNSGHIS